MKHLAFTFIFCALLVSAGAENPPVARSFLADWMTKMRPIVPRGYVCQRAVAAPVIDGKLDDPAWEAAPWTENFVDIEGDAKPKPRLRTRAKMLWDDEYFYVAAEMEEPHVWATITKHDEVIFQDPDFEVFMDPDGDSHDYYEFEMNALNTGWDLFLPKPYKDGGAAQNEWDIAGLKSAVHIRGTLNNPADRDEGWSVEIAFPWKALAAHANRPTPPREGDQWRVGFSRVEWEIETADGKYTKLPKTPEHNWIWSAQGVVDMHRPERWGFVQFTNETTRGKVVFRPDPSAFARDVLQTIYYAQKDFFAKHKRWAATFDELEFIARAVDTLSAPSLKITRDGYECVITDTQPGEAPRRWRIQHDAHITEITGP
jgi:hypothetical protein